MMLCRSRTDDFFFFFLPIQSYFNVCVLSLKLIANSSTLDTYDPCGCAVLTSRNSLYITEIFLVRNRKSVICENIWSKPETFRLLSFKMPYLTRLPSVIRYLHRLYQ